MRIKVKPKPVAGPEKTYSITGMTREEAEFLRELTGRFADNPGDGGIAKHFHTTLFAHLDAALGHGPKKFTFAGKMLDNGLVLHCRRWNA